MDEVTQLQEQVAKWRERALAAEEMVRSFEWMDTSEMGVDNVVCPMCRYSQHEGHLATCEMRRFLFNVDRADAQ